MERGMWVLAVILAMAILLLAQIQSALGDNSGGIPDSTIKTSNEITEYDVKPIIGVDPESGILDQIYNYSVTVRITPNKVKNVQSLWIQIIGYSPNSDQQLFTGSRNLFNPGSTETIYFPINPKTKIRNLMGRNYPRQYKTFNGQIMVKLIIKINENALPTYFYQNPEILYDIKPYTDTDDRDGKLYYYIEIAAKEDYIFNYHPYVKGEGKKNDYETKSYPKDCTKETEIGKTGILKWLLAPNDKEKTITYELPE